MKWIKTGDEYVEKKMTQFFSEAGTIVAAILFLDVIIRGFILGRPSSEYIISAIGFAVYAGWILFRYLLSGFEYPEIASQAAYRKKRKRNHSPQPRFRPHICHFSAYLYRHTGTSRQLG
nr:hypothetical protein [Bacillus paralicheniformis]WEZ24362.1 hypothetical protein P5637_00440 [Bacillus paralicheniformis]